MWTFCCGSCEETNATTVEGNSNTKRQTVNSGLNHSTTGPEVLCKACGGCFGTLARKHVCVDCKKSFCSRCSVQQELRPRLCLTCLHFHGTLFDRAALMRLKVKDLRDYLHLHEVPTQMCREKEELVELVLGQQTPSNSSSSEAVSQPDPTPPEAAPSPAHPSTPSDPPPPVDPEPHGPTDDLSSDIEKTLVFRRRASLTDISRLEDIEALSVRQLKEILVRNFVNYSGCCEKWELMERVTRLYNNQKDLRNQESADSTSLENLCKICMDSPINCVLLECGHMVTCSKCGKRMNECPICRHYIVRVVRVFKS